MGEIIMGKEADGFSHCLGAASTANPVDIIFGMTGEVVIDHVGDAFHIDSARGDVGRDEDANTAGFKILECAEPLVLGAVGVKSRAGDSQGFQTTSNTVGPVFRTGKDENGLHGFILQKMGKEGRFCVVGYFEQVLGYRFRRIRATPDFNQFRVMHELPSQPLDFSGKGSGKEQRLSLAGEKPDNLSDGWYETHIEHAVGLIQNQEF
jgi:hypothetical protein